MPLSRRRRFQFRLPYPLPVPQSFLSACLLLAASLTGLWLLRSTKGFWTTVTSGISIRLLYDLVAGGYVRQLRGWYAATYFPSVNLQQLCDSYRGQGEMDLPRELIDKIMRYNGDLQTLKNCSLTSRAFYSAARPLIHRRMALGISSVFRGSYPEMLPLGPDTGALNQAEVFHARYLSAAEERGLLHYGYVREVDLDLTIGNPGIILQFQQLRTLETVHTLTIHRLDLHKFLPIFDRNFSQFVPTLRSLSLKRPRCENADQLIEFASRFPHLDDLALISPRGPGDTTLTDAPLGSERPRSQQPLPLRGHLVLTGIAPRCLLDLPGRIRFHSIEVNSNIGDLGKLLVACSSTLEVLSIHCFEGIFPSEVRLRDHSVDWRSGERLSVNLGCNGILRQFEFAVDFAELDILPPFLHEALTSISSPHFSVFSLLLHQGLLEFKPHGGAKGRRVWGTRWEAIDEELCARAAGRHDFRLEVEIVKGQSTVAAVEEHFPRMKSKGLLLVRQQQPKW